MVKEGEEEEEEEKKGFFFFAFPRNILCEQRANYRFVTEPAWSHASNKSVCWQQL